MKKIMIIAAVMFAAIAANAAATKWTVVASALKGPDGTSTFSGSYIVLATDGTELLSGTISNGAITKSNFTVDDGVFTAGQAYTFNYILTTEVGGVEYTLTSTSKNGTATSTGTTSLNWGNQSSYTATKSNWVAAPEPTSALLMLLGMAGLALKRKRA